MPDIFVAHTKDKVVKEDIIPKEQDIVDPSNNLPDISLLDKRVHLFSSFCQNPEGITFQNQEKDEKVLLFLRKSMIKNLKWMITSFFLLLLPLFLFIAIGSTNIFRLPIKFLIYYAGFYYLIIFSYIYVNFITWYFNICLITNIRIIDIDYSSLVYKDIAVTKLSLIQDVSFKQIGVIPNLFNYGNIVAQTAGSIDNFDFEDIPDPEKAVHVIEDLIGKNASI